MVKYNPNYYALNFDERTQVEEKLSLGYYTLFAIHEQLDMQKDDPLSFGQSLLCSFSNVGLNSKHYIWASFDLDVNYVNQDASRFDIFGFQNNEQFISFKLLEL